MTAMKTEIRDGWLAADGLRVHYLAAGDAGDPLLLLHGGGLDCASLSWSDSLVPLAQHHRVFAPDLPGYGDSERPKKEGSIEYYIHFTQRLMETLGLETALLAGISMGGAISLGLTLGSPESVKKLVLVDSYGIGKDVPYGAVAYLMARMPFLNDLTWQMMVDNRILARASLEAIFHNPDSLSEELIEEIYRIMQRPGAARSWMRFLSNEITTDGLFTNYLDRLPEIQVPTLIVHGAEDRLVPVAWAERAHKLIVGSQLHVIQQCGHWAQREKPDEFNRVVSTFLGDEAVAPT
jgi:pimeloyl-ACP methyl ester carboxylesterase